MKYNLWGLALCVLLTAAFVAGCSGQPTEQPTPTASGGSQPTEGFAAISSGTLHTCGLREDGSAWCWGDNSEGQSSPTQFGFGQAQFRLAHGRWVTALEPLPWSGLLP